MELTPDARAGRESRAHGAECEPRRLGIPIRVLLVAALGAAALLLGACSGDDGDSSGTDTGSDVPTPGQEAASAALEADRIVIDVRTPEEYAAGHVKDATLIDVQGPEFDSLVAELDPDGRYVVYCRSGNRSAAASAQMTDEGLDVWDGGGIGDMEAAGWAVTTD